MPGENQRNGVGEQGTFSPAVCCGGGSSLVAFFFFFLCVCFAALHTATPGTTWPLPGTTRLTQALQGKPRHTRLTQALQRSGGVARAVLAARTSPEMLRLTEALHGLTQALRGLTHTQARRQGVFFSLLFSFLRLGFGIRDTKLIFLLKMKTLQPVSRGTRTPPQRQQLSNHILPQLRYRTFGASPNRQSA